MNFKDRLYYLLVDKNRYIKSDYSAYVSQNLNMHYKQRYKSWFLLLRLNIKYRVLHVERRINTRKVEKDLPYPETEYKRNISPVQLAKILLSYDVISFDIFDTLIFRPFNKPSDLFSLVGVKINFMEFRKYREQAERECRKKEPSNEVTIYDIYEEFKRLVPSSDYKAFMKTELETEFEFCFANPYMKQVFDILKMNNKVIIATSNMYIPEDILNNLLAKCGYEDFSRIFISCDYKMSKGDKLLYSYINNNFLAGRSVIHVGDNYKVDIVNAQQCGWATFYYPNCVELAGKYKAPTTFCLADSVYRGLTAIHFHNGLLREGACYQFGFLYGGLLVSGFCEYIENYCKNNNIDRIIWLARDGDIINKVYNKYFGKVDNKYMIWSRSIGTFLTINDSISDLFIRNIDPLIKWLKKPRIKDALLSTDCTFLNDYLLDYDLDSQTLLDAESKERLLSLFMDKQELIVSHHNKDIEVSKEYFEYFFEGKENICIVDVGWSGKSVLDLESYAKTRLGYKGKIKGLFVGCFNRPFTNECIASGKFDSYLFSIYKNRDLYNRFHSSEFIRTILIEILMTSVDPSALSFFANYDNSYGIKFSATMPENDEKIFDIQRGIIDFANMYYTTIENYRDYIQITPESAYMQINYFSENKKWINTTFDGFIMNIMNGFDNLVVQDEMPNIIGKE